MDSLNMQAVIPKLNPGKFSVLFAEKATGILLTTKGNRYRGEAEFYRVFDSEHEAYAFALAYAQSNPSVECDIRDCDGRHLKVVSCDK